MRFLTLIKSNENTKIGPVRLDGGRISTSDGLFAPGQEVVGAYAIFAVASKQEAVAWATRFMEVHNSIGRAGRARRKSVN